MCKYVLSQQLLHVTYEPRPLQMGIPLHRSASEAVLPFASVQLVKRRNRRLREEICDRSTSHLYSFIILWN